MGKLFLLFFFFAVSFSPAYAVRFDFRDALRRNSVDIVMEGPLERTVAISHFVSGWVELNPEAVSQGIRGELEVDMRTFETGMELKNIFLRDKIFDTAQFSTAQATFVKTVSFSSGRLVDGQAVSAKVEAQFRLKNITKNVILPLKLTYYKESDFSQLRLPGNLLLVTAAFELDLSTFGITLPEAIKTATHKTVQINGNFVGSDRLPTGIETLPDGPKPKK